VSLKNLYIWKSNASSSFSCGGVSGVKATEGALTGALTGAWGSLTGFVMTEVCEDVAFVRGGPKLDIFYAKF
jgi:hypothetical protein